MEKDLGSVSSRELNDAPSPTWQKQTTGQIEEIVAEQEDPFMKETRDLNLAARQEEESDSEAWIQEMEEIRIARKRERKEEEDSSMGIVDRMQRTRAAVAGLLFRGLKRLRSLLGPSGPSGSSGPSGPLNLASPGDGAP